MLPPEFLNLGLRFAKYFRAVPALTEEQKRACYRIRHDVYCTDLGFEPARPDGMETDAHDANAIHCLLQSVATDEYVGCIRLIPRSAEDPSRLLPLEETCAAVIDRRRFDPGNLPVGTIAEVSRLAVVRRYRRRKGEMQSPGGISDDDFGAGAQPRFPFIPVGLYLGMIAQARRQRIKTLVVLTEPRLQRHLSRLGVAIEQIGAAVEHRGVRVPSMMSVDAIVNDFGFLMRPLFAAVAEQIETEYHNVARSK
jgi:N-acyl amino acid synthase of PEP-CTERM/exosortase system